MAKTPRDEEKKEQAVPAGTDDDEYDNDDDDDDEQDCFPCLACWQIIAIAVIVGCLVIGAIVAAVILFVKGGGDSDDGNGGSILGGGGGGGKVDFPPDTMFKVEIQNQYNHGTLGGKTYDVSFDLTEGDREKKPADPTTTDIRAFFRSEENGLASIEVTVIIDFNLDGDIDCNHVFYTSVDINSGDFGAWSSDKSCTYTSGGIYQHKVRAKVTSY